MSESSIAVAEMANGAVAKSCSESRGIIDHCKMLQWSFRAMARKLWPKKTAAHLQFLTTAPERTCHHWASAERCDPPASLLVTLLRGDEGGRVLDFVMGGSVAPWWLQAQRARIVTDAFDNATSRINQQLRLNL
jgi:hypothetical protein